MARKAISKKTRFEVFKRDSFTCQYCGAKAPDVLLQVDHIKPVAKSGPNEILNLITSCQGCNGGKGARELSDHSVLVKQRDQLAALQERKGQLEMMMQWQRGSLSIEDDTVQALSEFWYELTRWSVTTNGRIKLRKWLKTYAAQELIEAMKASVATYPEGQAFDYVGRIARCKRSDLEKPFLKDLLYVRGILRNRLDRFDEHEALTALEAAHESGVTIDTMKDLARYHHIWDYWVADLARAIGEASNA